MDLLKFINEYAQNVSLVAGLIFILVGGKLRWWVWGYQLTEAQAAILAMKVERDEWKTVAMSGLRSTEKAVGMASTALTPKA
jgi:hypothetical protein